MAGIVGIGGGIYLVPLILILGLGTEREAAAAGALAVGAVLGAWLGASWLSRRTMQRVLGGIVLLAIVLLIDDVFGGASQLWFVTFRSVLARPGATIRTARSFMSDAHPRFAFSAAFPPN